MDDLLDPRHKVGRIFGEEWTIANVAKLLRFNAGQGMLRAGAVSGSVSEMNLDYMRKTSARHIPSGVTVGFRRAGERRWQAELCFAALDRYLPWNDALAENWLDALFGADRPRVRETSEAVQIGGVRRFELED